MHWPCCPIWRAASGTYAGTSLAHPGPVMGFPRKLAAARVGRVQKPWRPCGYGALFTLLPYFAGARRLCLPRNFARHFALRCSKAGVRYIKVHDIRRTADLTVAARHANSG